MAFVGLRYPVFAPIKTEERGKAIVYDPGVVIGRAMSANIELTRNEEGLYADDVLAESDNSITGGTIEIGVDDILEDAQVTIFGLKSTPASEGVVAEYKETDAPAPYGGVGYIRVRRYKGATSYLAYWLHKVQFGSTSEEATTKGESIEWQTPTASGNVMGVYLDDSGNAEYRTHAVFTAEGEAVAWLNAKANITAAQPAANAKEGAGNA